MVDENKYELLAEKRYNAKTRSETAYGVAADYGTCENVMRLVRNGRSLSIEWSVFKPGEKEAIDEAEIGITTVGKKVIEYDGVFELPKEAIQLLNEYGLNTKDVEG